MNQRRLLCLGGALLLVVVLAFFVQKWLGPQEISVPDEAMFVDAPSADTCEEFVISFSFDDSFDPVRSDDMEYQTLRWELSITPKEGVSVDDFYCTLILNDWLLEQSSSPSLKYMGLGRGHIGNMPEESIAFRSGMEKLVPLSLLDHPSYQEAVGAPVRLMIGYDGQEYYYWVTPTEK